MKLFVVKETKKFIKVFEQLSLVLSEVNILIDSNGISLQSMDSSTVILSILEMNKSFFEHFYYKEKTSLELGIYLKSLINILKILDTSNLLFEYKNDKLEISTEDKYYSLVLMEIDSDMMNIEELDYPVNLVLDSKFLRKTIKDVLIHDPEDIKFNFNNNIIISTSSDKGDCSIIINSQQVANSNDLTDQLKRLSLKDYSVIYGSKFLTKLIQVPDSNINLSFDKNMPLKIEYTDKSYSLKFFLAPKIDDDEEYNSE